jgi:integrase
MASIQKRGSSWRAQVRLRGVSEYRTFVKKTDAVVWAATREAEIRQTGDGKLPDKTLADVLARFVAERCPQRRYGRAEGLAIRRMLAHDMAQKKVSALSPADIAAWRDLRLRMVSPAAVDREMNLLSSICSTATNEWGWLRKNPVSNVRRPPPTPPRDRRITPDEIERICYVLGYAPDKPLTTKSARVGAAFCFAIETGMRVGEIAALATTDVDLARRTAHVRGESLGAGKSASARRKVPLTREAARIVAQLPPHPALFNLGTASQVDALFRAARDKAGVAGLHFHDTRHEAITRLSRKMDVLALARAIGHRDLKMLMTYYNESAEDIAQRLD